MQFTVDLTEFKSRLAVLCKSVSAAGAKPMNTRLKVVAENSVNYIDVEVVGAQGRGTTRFEPKLSKVSDVEVIINSDHILDLPDGVGGEFEFTLIGNKLQASNDKMTHRFDIGDTKDWLTLDALPTTINLSKETVTDLARSIPRICDFTKASKDADVLSSVKMVFSGKSIQLQATNVENAILKTIEVKDELPSLTVFVPANWFETWASLIGEGGLCLGYKEGCSYITVQSNPVVWTVTHNTLDGTKFRDVGELFKKAEGQKFTSDFGIDAVKTAPSLKCATGFQSNDALVRLASQDGDFILSSSGGNAESKVRLYDGNELVNVRALTNISLRLKSLNLLLQTTRELVPERTISIRCTDKMVMAKQDGLSILISQIR